MNLNLVRRILDSHIRGKTERDVQKYYGIQWMHNYKTEGEEMD